MKYSQEQLAKIEELAAIYTPPTEIAIEIDVPEHAFKIDIAMPDSDARKAYIKGNMSQKTEIRRQMALLARVGSPLALQMSEKALLEMEDDEL